MKIKKILSKDASIYKTLYKMQIKQFSVGDNNLQSKKFITYYGEYSLKHWIRMILCGEIKLPPYQRYFVWSPEKVLRLIENINNDLFIPPVILSSFSGDETDKEANYILDGQQRLSAVLIASLGFFPAKFDTFISDLINEDSVIPEGTYDDEITIAPIKWDLSIIQEIYNQKNILGLASLKEELEKDSRYIKIDKDFLKSFKEPKKVSSNALETYLNIAIDDDFLDNHYLGFSYIKPVVSDACAEKNMFSSIFRNINISSVPLLPEESRAALYWLKPDVVSFLDANFSQTIKVNNRKMDFARSVAYVAEAYMILEKYPNNPPSILKVAMGYGRTRRFEDYIEKYVYNVTENKHSDTFGNFQDLFPNYMQSLNNLKEEFTKLSLPKNYQGLVELDFYLFGLLYWVLFKGKCINKSSKDELKEKLDKAIKNHKKEYLNVAQLGALRERLTSSIKMYKKFAER